jgi:hypothetical protein
MAGDDGMSLNVKESDWGLATAAPAEAAPSVRAAVPARPAMVVHAATRARMRRLGNVLRFMIGESPVSMAPDRRLLRWRSRARDVRKGYAPQVPQGS